MKSRIGVPIEIERRILYTEHHVRIEIERRILYNPN